MSENPFYIDPKVAKQEETDRRLERLKRQTQNIARRKDERAMKNLSQDARAVVLELRKLRAGTTDHSVGSEPLVPKEGSKSANANTLPAGVTVNDTLVWNGSAWEIFAAPSATGNWVRTVQNGVNVWHEIGNC